MRLFALAAAAGLLAMPLAAHADIIGDTIHVTYNYPAQGTVLADLGNFTVPGGANVLGQASFQITANQVLISSITQSGILPSAFNGFVFTDLTKNPFIIGATLDPASTFSGAQVSFTTNSVAVNLSGTPISPGETAIVDLSFGSAPSAVTPEPSSIALLGTGLLGAFGVMRRRLA